MMQRIITGIGSGLALAAAAAPASMVLDVGFVKALVALWALSVSISVGVTGGKTS